MLELHRINSRIFYIKYCLIAFTVLFALTGLSLVVIGTTINEVFVEFSYFLENEYFAPAVFLYSVGLVVFAISIIGVVGALKENSCIITSYGILLGIVFILQIAIGMSANILMQGTISAELKERLSLIMTRYKMVPDYRVHADALQQAISCCGIYNPNDWMTLNDGSTPASCCAKLDAYGTCSSFYQRGCLEVLELIVNEVTNVLSASAFILAFMQLAGMCFALYLGRALRTQKLAKQYRRWTLSNQLLTESTVFGTEKNSFPELNK
ncbi:hypothetical protein O3M35_005924 [Rhynocoris fuscipes]|uniref:Tetraspanin n=1 Tax=Rhynocoris fuscipes TaxID=488301 RepID=A0AAW1DD26_9HEMI